MLISFVQCRATIAAVQLSSKVAFDLLELSNENERKHKAKEMYQLRSLMGNVAHDLKTPLHSIEADLKVLNTFKQGSMFPSRPDESVRLDAKGEGMMTSEQIHLDIQAVKPRVTLLIDDALSILKVTSRLLSINGHSVKTAANGSIGLKILKEAYINQEFNMVLTYLQMPVMAINFR